MSQSELGRRTGVSRQAVSLWLRSGVASLQGRHLVKVSQALGLTVEQLVQPLPCLEPGVHDRMRATLLWDRLYPGLDDFAIALNHKQPRAIARLVEVHGLYGAAKVLDSRSVWGEFARYSRFIHPARRKQLEILHAWYSSQSSQTAA